MLQFEIGKVYVDYSSNSDYSNSYYKITDRTEKRVTFIGVNIDGEFIGGSKPITQRVNTYPGCECVSDSYRGIYFVAKDVLKTA